MLNETSIQPMQIVFNKPTASQIPANLNFVSMAWFHMSYLINKKEIKPKMNNVNV